MGKKRDALRLMVSVIGYREQGARHSPRRAGFESVRMADREHGETPGVSVIGYLGSRQLGAGKERRVSDRLLAGVAHVQSRRLRLLIDGVNHAIIADPDAIGVFAAIQFATSRRPRI